MAYLALIKHGDSEWSAKNLWTGWMDVPLSNRGITEAKLAYESIKNERWDIAFVSSLNRSQETLDVIKKLSNYEIQTIVDKALNERDYGDFDGKNRSDVEKQIGEKAYQDLRRAWNTPVPNGETLKDVYSRVVPYFKTKIFPKLKAGKNIIVSAHGNSLRALVKYIDKISDKDIAYFDLPTGKVRLYQWDEGKLELVHP